MITVKISGTGVPNDVIDIINELPSLDQVNPENRIVLDFSSAGFVFMTGLALLAAWRKYLPAGVVVNIDDNRCSLETQRFLTNTGFREIIDTGHEFPSMQRRVGRVPLQPITNRHSAEATVSAITEIFDEYAGHVKSSNPFNVLLSELCENVLAHSELTHPGYACARVQEDNLKAEISIVDTGIGILESYLRGTNDIAIERIKRGASSIEIAVDGLNSSKPRPARGQYKSYYGYGLFITRRLIEENSGILTIISGNEGLTIGRGRRTQHRLDGHWPGTFVGLVLDLGNRLPLEEIYDEGAEKRVQSPVPTQSKLDQVEHPSVTITPPPVTASISVVPETPTVKVTSETKTIELQHYGTQLLTREAGMAIRADLATVLVAGGNAQVSLDGVSDITPSVADEAFGKLAEAIGWESFESRVKFIGGSPLTLRLIEFVIKTRAKSGLPIS